MVLNLQAVEQSVQSHPDFPAGVDGYGFSFYYRQSFDILPPPGRLRDLNLRQLWMNNHNTLNQGTGSNLIMRLWSTPYEIIGGKRSVFQWDDILRNSEFSQGYEDFMSMFLQDYFTQGNGGFIEIIAAGAADKPIGSRPVLGVAQLDALNCYATGNPEYPIVYYDWFTGEHHRMHYTRVRRMTDMPSPDRRAFGRGLSSFERSIAISNAQILLSRHQQELLNNQPPTGIMSVSGIHPQQYDDAKRIFQANMNRDGNALWPGIMELKAIEPGQEIKVDFVPFSQVPEGFTYKEFMEQHVNLQALAWGVDPQDIWPLTGAPLGTGAQSKILDAKGRAKAYGSTLARLERLFNGILPKNLEFKFKPNDTEAEKIDADTAQIWVGVASSLKAVGASTEQALQLMANQVGAFADVLLDESGQLRLQDDDPKDETAAQDQVIATDDTPPTPGEAAAQPAVTAGDDNAPMGSGTPQRTMELGRGKLGVYRKDFTATQIDYTSDLADLISGGLSDEVSRRRAGTVMRALNAKYIRQAMKDGLEDGGIEDAILEGDDLSKANELIAEQSGYVTDFLDKLYSDNPGVNDVEARVILWANKALVPAYQAGLISADRDGLYEWVYGDTEHCDTCLRLNGQKHRLHEWEDHYMPQSEELDCGGWRCECKLVKSKGRSSGNF